MHLYVMKDEKIKTLAVRLPEGFANELDKLINVDGLFLSNSDILKYGARLLLLLSRGIKTLEEIRKEARDRM